MFFKPPVVKAISKYSDFGSHLGPKSFTVMLTIAIALHAAILGAYAMMPHTKVIKIPVRVLNINLGANLTEPVPAAEQPVPEPAHALPATLKIPTEDPNASKKVTQVTLDKALAGQKTDTSTKPAPPPKAMNKNAIVLPDKKTAGGKVFAMPKKYVRESQMDAAKPKDAKASTSKQEMAERYEQVISLWVRQHQIYPQEAKERRAEGTAMVRLQVNRQGHITYYVIEKSTGDAFLDHAAMAMVRASDPAPPIPDDYHPDEDPVAFMISVSWDLEKER